MYLEVMETDTHHAALTAALDATPPPAELTDARQAYAAGLRAMGLTLRGWCALEAALSSYAPTLNPPQKG